MAAVDARISMLIDAIHGRSRPMPPPLASLQRISDAVPLAGKPAIIIGGGSDPTPDPMLKSRTARHRRGKSSTAKPEPS